MNTLNNAMASVPLCEIPSIHGHKTLPIVFLFGLLMLANSLPAQSKDTDWTIGFEVAAIDGDLSNRNTTAGFELGYQLFEDISLELVTRSVTSGSDSGRLTSSMFVWRSQPEKMYFKVSGGLTLGAGDLFDDFSGSFGLGIGYATESLWSFELTATRLSDDVNAISLITLYRF